MFSEKRQGNALPIESLSLSNVILLSVVAYLSYWYIKGVMAYRVRVIISVKLAPTPNIFSTAGGDSMGRATWLQANQSQTSLQMATCDRYREEGLQSPLG